MYRVFLADDEPWVLISLQNLIDWNGCGYTICGEADSGKSAWERILHIGPDLILSDIRMPGFNGLKLLEKIRNKKLQTKVIFISAYSDFEYARAAIRLGCSDYLLKPIEAEELKKALDKIKDGFDLSKGGSEKNGYISDNVIAKDSVSFIQNNYRNPISLSELSEKYRLSECYLSSLIKKKTGKSFSEHIMECRIQKAQELLRTTNESIAEIASDVGYSDYFYFIKVYKKVTGLTPAAYRKQF
ncbi:MAG: response regulator [Clostridiales bacterium]|nr:response regulator [Clostridiales bacterium]